MLHRRDSLLIGAKSGGAVFHAGGYRFAVSAYDLAEDIILVLPVHDAHGQRLIIAVFIGIGIGGFYILEPVLLFVPASMDKFLDRRAVLAVNHSVSQI